MRTHFWIPPSRPRHLPTRPSKSLKVHSKNSKNNTRSQKAHWAKPDHQVCKSRSWHLKHQLNLVITNSPKIPWKWVSKTSLRNIRSNTWPLDSHQRSALCLSRSFALKTDLNVRFSMLAVEKVTLVSCWRPTDSSDCQVSIAARVYCRLLGRKMFMSILSNASLVWTTPKFQKNIMTSMIL